MAEVIYIVSYPPGSGGRFIATLLWNILTNNNNQINISINGNAHNNYNFLKNYVWFGHDGFHEKPLIAQDPSKPLIVPTHDNLDYTALSKLYKHIRSIHVTYEYHDRYLLSINFFYKVIIEQLIHNSPGPTGFRDFQWAQKKWQELEENLNLLSDPTHLTIYQIKQCLDYIIDRNWGLLNLFENHKVYNKVQKNLPNNCDVVEITPRQIFYHHDDILKLISNRFNLIISKEIINQYKHYLTKQHLLKIAEKITNEN